MHGHIDLFVWGCISADGECILHTVHGTLNAGMHHKFLINHLIVDETVLVDGARPHSTKKIIDDLEMFGIEVIKNPPYSPDLNPIEMVWSMMKRRVYSSSKVYASVDELECAVHEA